MYPERQKSTLAFYPERQKSIFAFYPERQKSTFAFYPERQKSTFAFCPEKRKSTSAVLSAGDGRALLPRGGACMGGKKLYKSNDQKMICGVCGGIAEFFEIDPTIVRLVFAVLGVAGGSGLLLYIAAAFIIPPAP